MEKTFDIIIIGGGPAGISAGIYALRAGTKVLVLDGNKSALLKAKYIQNYYGVEKIEGKELLNKGKMQFVELGGSLLEEEVVNIGIGEEDNIFTIRTSEDLYKCSALILCTGSGQKKTIPGLEAFEDANVSYCAICDGFFYRDKTVAVIGEDKFAINEANELSKNAKVVYLIAENIDKDAKLASNIEIINKKIKSFVGKEMVEKIEFEDESTIAVGGVFVALGSLSSYEIAKQMGILTNKNCILVDKYYMTNVAGIFAAGDCIGGLLQVSKAVSDGASAGLSAVRYVKMLEDDK